MGGAVTVLAWWIWQALSTDDVAQDAEWRYDVSRINALRKADPIYRLFQTILQAFGKLNRAAFSKQLPEIYREIQAAGHSRFWLPEEYLGRMQLIAIFMFPIYAYLAIRNAGPSGLFLAVMLTGITVWFLRRQLTVQARKRLNDIKRRMPFLLDMLTLLIEAGSSFLHALQEGVDEFEGHPVSQEFSRVLSDMKMGKARSEAFENLQTRLNDDEITSIVGSIVQGEELGTPLSHIFRTQADVLRIKRSQRAETIAGEAAVNMLLPGVLIMASTVLLILGPFIIKYMPMIG